MAWITAPTDRPSSAAASAADNPSMAKRVNACQENADVHVQRVTGWVPDDGEVRVLTITDKQYERMRIFWGKRRKPPEKPPPQLMLF